MHGVWKHILPHCANSSDFKEETIVEEITNIGRELGFDGLENDDVGNCSIHSWKNSLMMYF
jgi:hypothetical protein